MPTIALWGGPTDNLMGFSFDDMMLDLEAGLSRDNHFLVECIHNCGHAPPLLEMDPNEPSPLSPFFDFLHNHPYQLSDGDSPYLLNGLPAAMPDWCAIGVGSATPANITNCPQAI